MIPQGNIVGAAKSGSGGITFTDGTHTVSGATQLTVSGGTIGGTSPNATLTVTGGSSAFSAITSGTNTTAAMVVGNGASLTVTGTGSIHATNIAGTLGAGSGISITGGGSTGNPYIITAGGVTSLNGYTGAVVLAASSNIALTGSGGTIDISVVPAGANNWIQYYNGGVLGADAGLNYDPVTQSIVVGGGSVQATGTFITKTYTVPADPGAGGSFDFSGNNITESGSGSSHVYEVYYQYNPATGIIVYDPTPGTVSISESFAATGLGLSENQYTSSGYTANGQNFTYEIIPIYNSGVSPGKTTTQAPASNNITDTINDGTSFFTISLSWSLPTFGGTADGFYIVNTTLNTYTAVGGGVTSAVDDGTWANYGSITPPTTPLTFNIDIAITNNGAFTAPLYSYYVFDSTHSQYQIAAITSPTSQTFVDIGTGWTSGSLSTPTSYQTEGLYTDGNAHVGENLYVGGASEFVGAVQMDFTLTVSQSINCYAGGSFSGNLFVYGLYLNGSVGQVAGLTTNGTTGVATVIGVQSWSSMTTSASYLINLYPSLTLQLRASGQILVNSGTGSVQFTLTYTDQHGTARSINLGTYSGVGSYSAPSCVFYNLANNYVQVNSTVVGTINYDYQPIVEVVA